MEFGRLWALRGPNIWARVPVLEVEVETGEPAAWPGFGAAPDRCDKTGKALSAKSQFSSLP